MEHDPVETRRRRALFRAMHRGTKEMDWLLGKYAEAKLATMSEEDLTTFEEFLSIADPDLNAWIITPALVESRAFGPLVTAIRAFHGLDAALEATSGVSPDAEA